MPPPLPNIFTAAKAIDAEAAETLFSQWLSALQRGRGKPAKAAHTALKAIGLHIAVYDPDPELLAPTRPKVARY